MEANKMGERDCRPKQNRNPPYKTMGMQDIKAYQAVVKKLEATKCNIFIWTIDSFLYATEKMMWELGYQPHVRLIWNKMNGPAPAFTVRYSHEYLLWYYQPGKLLHPVDAVRGKYTSVFAESSTIHSRKPECSYVMLEKMFPGARKLEMYSRIDWPGWR